MEEAGDGFVGEGGELGGTGLDGLQEFGGGEVVGGFELGLDQIERGGDFGARSAQEIEIRRAPIRGRVAGNAVNDLR